MHVSSKPPESHPWGSEPTPFAALGGSDRVEALADAFYDRVELESPILRSMLPVDTSNSRRKLFEFLSGWLGGPQLYLEKRGHPRLRIRHAPFAIDDRAAKEWVSCFAGALDDVEAGTELREFLLRELGQAALHLRNRP